MHLARTLSDSGEDARLTRAILTILPEDVADASRATSEQTCEFWRLTGGGRRRAEAIRDLLDAIHDLADRAEFIAEL